MTETQLLLELTLKEYKWEDFNNTYPISYDIEELRKEFRERLYNEQR